MMPLAAIDWHSVCFLLFALVTCGFAVAVVLTSNIVRMAFYLTLSLGATSGLFFLAGAEFVGAMQLLIYVGGTLVLLIFGVMLTAQARFISMQTSGAEWVMAAILGSALLGILVANALFVDSWRTARADREAIALVEGKTSTPIGLALSGVRVDKLDETNERLRGGMSGYLLPFVIVSMHLLVVLIGAAYMARTKRIGRGAMWERVTPAAPPVRRRNFAVTGGIVSGIFVNLILAILCFGHAWRPASLAAATGPMARVNEFLAPAASWLFPCLGGLFLANVLLLAVVYSWQRWGVIGLVLVPIAGAVAVGNGGLGTTAAVVLLVLALAPVTLLIGIICGGPKPTMWEQME
jgi:NADH-quinone oxidoreductase subunit J